MQVLTPPQAGSRRERDSDHLACAPTRFTHIGWTLGNYCPYTCTHCYSEWVRDSSSGLTRNQVDEICTDLAALGVRHVTLGGNEPFFTNGPHLNQSLLPHIVRTLYGLGIAGHLVTSGPSVTLLERVDPSALALLASVNLSFDSPFADEHNMNRGAPLYEQLLRAAGIVSAHGVRTILLYCAMDWNFDQQRISGLFDLASRLDAHPRINPAKPIVRNGVVTSLLGMQGYWSGFDYVTRNWSTQIVTEPPLRRALGLADLGPACGSRTFRILPVDKDNIVKIAGCTYVHRPRTEVGSRIGIADLARQLDNSGPGDCVARVSSPGWCPGVQDHLRCVPNWTDRRLVASDLNGAFEDYLCTWVGSRA